MCLACKYQPEEGKQRFVLKHECGKSNTLIMEVCDMEVLREVQYSKLIQSIMNKLKIPGHHKDNLHKKRYLRKKLMGLSILEAFEIDLFLRRKKISQNGKLCPSDALLLSCVREALA